MLKELLIAYAGRREPDLTIGGRANPYMRRWFLIPRNPVFNLYLHEIVRDDDDRALHDHPWINLSWVMRGGYWEVLFVGAPKPGKPLPSQQQLWRPPGFIGWRHAKTAHRLVLGRDPSGHMAVPCWSLFVTGPKLRSWGFWCGNTNGSPAARWVHWRIFTAGPRGELVGAGCDEA